jgi:hypothetical protein
MRDQYQQLAFIFMGDKYDIFTDTTRPMHTQDLAVLQEVYQAYGRVRQARALFGLTKLGNILDKIHEDLTERIKKLEPDKPQ